MAAFKKHLLFFISIILLLLLAVGGLTYIFISASKSSEASDKLSAAESSLRAALSQSPASTQANLEASEKNVSDLESVLKAQVASTQGTSAQILEASPPTTGTNMYYDLLAYKNELDKDSKVIVPIGKKEAGVAVPENFDWGFSRYLQAGAGAPPKDKDIPAIFRQKTILNYLLRKLLATQPRSIVSVQREPIAIDKPGAQQKGKQGNNQAQTEEGKSDEFWIGTESAKVPGVVNTMAFRITFTGYSQNLRAFLKEIAAFELPLVVRSVEVKPAVAPKTTTARNQNQSPGGFESIFGGSSGGSTQTNSTSQSQEPVVESNVSEFTVVIEYINVKFKS